jgi:hypothetical protein
MGKSLKAVAGLALVAVGMGWTAGGLISAGWAATALGFTSYGAIASMIGLSLAGMALAPDLGDIFGTDSYGGVKLQTQKSNTSAVPTLYGYNRVAGNIIFEATNEEFATVSGTRGYNRDYWAVICLCSHKCADSGYTSSGTVYAVPDIDEMTCMIGDESMVVEYASNSGGWDTLFTGSWGSLKNTTDAFSGDGGNIRQAFVTTPRTYSLSNIKNHVVFKVHNRPTSEPTANYFDYGTNLALNDTNTLPLGTYITTHQIYDSNENNNTQLQNITVELKGKMLRELSLVAGDYYVTLGVGTYPTYSNNPALILMDMMENGLSINPEDGGDYNTYGYKNPDHYDLQSFFDAKTYLNTRGWSCNLVMVNQANIQSHINDVLATCRGQLVFSNGKWKLIIDNKGRSVSATLTADDIVNNSLSIAMSGSADIANKIICKYINPDDEWLPAQATIESLDLQDLDGQVIEKVIDVKGCTNTAQAEVLAEITLNSMRYTENSSGDRINQTPLSLSLATTVKNAHLEVGDVIAIDHDLLDRTRKFVILSVETDQSGIIQITSREYCETHYKDSSGTYLI